MMKHHLLFLLSFCNVLSFSMAVVLHVFEPLGEDWYATVNFNKSHAIHPRLKITESSISGFSAGAMLTANIMSMEP